MKFKLEHKSATTGDSRLAPYFLREKRLSGSIPLKVGGIQTRTTNNTAITSKKAQADNIWLQVQDASHNPSRSTRYNGHLRAATPIQKPICMLLQSREMINRRNNSDQDQQEEQTGYQGHCF